MRLISDQNRNPNKQAYLDSTSIGNPPIVYKNVKVKNIP